MISVNIATHKKRESFLKKSIKTLLDQNLKPDLIRVYFNDYKTPEWFVTLKKKHPHLRSKSTSKDLKASGKFYWLSKSEHDEIYLTCDDDILYPDNYIRYITDMVYVNHSSVGFDGTILNHSGITNKWPFNEGNNVLRNVNLLGTGTTALIAEQFANFRPSDTYSDIELAEYAQKQGHSFICPVRASGWLRQIKGHYETSIQRSSDHIDKLNAYVSTNRPKLFNGINYSHKDFGGWSICLSHFTEIRRTLPSQSKVVEFGSGGTTKYLNRVYEVISIEDNVHYYEKYRVEKSLLTELKDGWYDLNDEDVNQISQADAYLIDGPSNGQRAGILNILDRLNPNAFYFVDDCHRDKDKVLAKTIAKQLNKNIEYINDRDKIMAKIY